MSTIAQPASSASQPPTASRLNPGIALLGVGLLSCLCGCGTMDTCRGWGEDAVYPMDWGRLPRAAGRALLDPATYVPAAGALLFAIDDWDERASRWATEHNPIFGSEEGAKDASDLLRTILVFDAFGTAALTPSGKDPPTWAWAKTRGVGVELGAWQASLATRSVLQDVITRERPDGSGDNSFPSGHATGAFSCAALANRNLNFIEMPSPLRSSLKGLNYALATGVAYARVEGKKHYPSDVLAGAALGNFLTLLIHDTFTGLPEDNLGFFVTPGVTGGGAMLSFEF